MKNNKAKKISTPTLLAIIIASAVGIIGKEIANELFFQSEADSAYKKCVDKYGVDKSICKKIIEETAEDVRLLQNQSGVQRQESVLSAEKKAFIVGCTAQGINAEYCECSYRFLIDHYGYEEYLSIRSKISKLDSESLISSNDPDVKDFVELLQHSIPPKCQAE